MDASELHKRLKAIQEPKGYFFNPDEAMTMPLLESLLVNLGRYGHMACPCRLASGDKEADRDVICPCVYREADVAEYGACYCGLYVSPDWIEGRIPRLAIPERRPPEKTMAALMAS